MLPKNQQATEEIKKFLETKDNENTITQSPWDAAKTVLRGKFIAILSYLEKQEKHKINSLTLHLKQLEKEEEEEQQQQQKNEQKERNHKDPSKKK